jgi:tetratricopeptide (TPR) repeat protein
VLAGSTVVLALALGAAIATWQAFAATRAKSAAEASDAETRSVLDFVDERIFSAPRPKGRQGGLGPAVSLRETLESALPALDTAFAKQPLVEARLRMTLGNSFWHLSDARPAADQFAKARAIYMRIAPQHPALPGCTMSLANCRAALGEHAQAIKLHEEVLAQRTATLGLKHRDTLVCMHNLASDHLAAGRPELALEMHQRALGLMQTNLGADDPSTLASMHAIGGCYMALGRYTDAIELYEKTWALKKQTLGPDHPETLSTMNNLGAAYGEAGHKEKALKLLEESAALHRTGLGPTHAETLATLGNLANNYVEGGQDEKALKLREELLAVYRKHFPATNPDTIRSMNNLALSYKTAGRYREAITLYQEALKVRRAMLAPDHPDLLRSMGTLAACLAAFDRGAEAIPLIDDCVRRSAGKAVVPGMIPALMDIRLRYFRDANDAQGCQATAELWDEGKRTDAESLLRAARYHAVTSALLRVKDPSEKGARSADAEADRAMAWLRQATDTGLVSVNIVKQVNELSVLQDRADFRTLIAKLEAGRK